MEILRITESELLRRYAAGERDFKGVDLKDADLSGAELGRADLSGLNLKSVVLHGFKEIP